VLAVVKRHLMISPIEPNNAIRPKK
jgi:hypothetical protein